MEFEDDFEAEESGLPALSPEIVVAILEYLTAPGDLCSVFEVCRKLRSFDFEDLVWRNLCKAWDAVDMPPSGESWRDFFRNIVYNASRS